MAEITVNRALEQHIVSPLVTPANTGPPIINVSDENAIGDEEEDPNKPISENLKHDIYSHLANLKQNDRAIDPSRINMVKNMTEDEGKSYLEVLKAQRAVNFSRNIGRTFVNVAVDKLTNQRDDFTHVLAANDDNLVDEVSASLGGLFAKFGPYKGYFMMGLYIASSWMKNWTDPLTLYQAQSSVNVLLPKSTEPVKPEVTTKDAKETKNTTTPTTPSTPIISPFTPGPGGAITKQTN